MRLFVIKYLIYGLTIYRVYPSVKYKISIRLGDIWERLGRFSWSAMSLTVAKFFQAQADPKRLGLMLCGKRHLK